MSDLVELINVLGFPIAVCLALFYINREMMIQQQKLLTEFQNTVRDNTEMMRDTNELTKILIRELNMTKQVIKDEL